MKLTPSCLKTTLRSVTQILQDLKLAFNQDLVKVLTSNYLVSHLDHGTILCKGCELPTKIAKKMKSVTQEQSLDHGYNWPQNKPYTLYPFLNKAEDFVAFCIPRGIFQSHVSRKSPVVKFKKPKLQQGMEFASFSYN